MKAKDFEFDGKRLSDFGFIIANFDAKDLETIDGTKITFNTISSLGGSKHNLTSTQYETCLETCIQVCKYSCSTGIQEISPIEFREISRWLNRKKFLKFKILDENYIDLYYMASIISIGRIELDGRLIGLELNIITDSPHSFKEPRTINVVCKENQGLYGWEKYGVGLDSEIIKLGYVTSEDENAYPSGLHTDGYQYIPVGKVYKSSINDTSYEEGFIYPYTEIIINESGNLKIHNSIENRESYIANCIVGEVITMDYPVIRSSISSHNIQNDFNWNFFRIANTFDNSRNDLTVSLPCTIKIKYSPIVKVGL